MAILIVVGFIVLIIGFYKKFNNINYNKNSKDKYLISPQIDADMGLKSTYISGDRIIVSYESNKLVKIFIFDFIKEKLIKQIDLLK